MSDFPVPDRPKPQVDYLGVTVPDPVHGDWGVGRMVGDEFVKYAMRTATTPIHDAVVRDTNRAAYVEEERALSIREHWTTGPGSEPMTFPPEGGPPIPAGAPVECAECGRTIKSRHDGFPVRHKYPTKSKGWCPGR